MIGKFCRDCEFWWQYKTKRSRGQCRIRAATIGFWFTGWQSTDGGDGCGEFKPKKQSCYPVKRKSKDAES